MGLLVDGVLEILAERASLLFRWMQSRWMAMGFEVG